MKKIIFGKGKYKAIVDDDDYERLSKFGWWISNEKYARSNIRPGGISKLMAHFILQPPAGFQIDHINRNALDNRRENLRVVTARENVLNRKIPSHNKSGFRGVCYYSRTDRWLTQVSRNGKKIYKGYFKNKVDAAIAYDMVVLMVNGDFAQTNVLQSIQ